MASDVTLRLLFHLFMLLCCVLSNAEEEIKLVTRPLDLDSNWFFELVEPEKISYTYKVRPAKNFGASMNRTLFRVELVPTQPLEGCSDIQNHIFIRDSIALMQRGGCSFLTKCINAEKAGALAAIIFDNKHDNDDSMIDMIQDETERTTSIPAFFLLGKDGYMIQKTLQENHLQYAVINIPVNITGLNAAQVNHPPWTIW